MEIGVNDDILSLIDITSGSLLLGIAQRVKQRRLEKGWAQKMFAARVGVALPAFRRFEYDADWMQDGFSILEK